MLRHVYRSRPEPELTLCHLSAWPAAHIEGLRGVLKGGTVIPAEREAFTVIRTLPHGHVAAALGTARSMTVSSALTAIAAVISSLRCWLAGSSNPHPSLPPPAHSPLQRPPRALARCSASARSTRTNPTPRWTGCWSARPPS